MIDYIILAGMWLLYGVIHSLFAANWIKKIFKRISAGWERYYRVTYSFFSMLLLVPVLWFQFTIRGVRLFNDHFLTISAGLLLMAGGIFWMILSFRNYDIHEFTGWRQIKGRTESMPMQDSGMLSVVRHPLYSGSILILIGYFLFHPFLANLVMSIMLILYFLVGIHFEEKKLVQEYGEGYEAYRRKVPALFPSVKKLFRRVVLKHRSEKSKN